MLNTPFSINESSTVGIITVSKEFFEEKAVLAAFVKYTPSFYISIEPSPELSVKITIERKDSNTIEIQTLKEMMNELIDQQVREELDKKFNEIKKTIVKHAFEPVEL